MICSQSKGIAIGSNIVFYKIFDKYRRTKTSWIIKALDHVIYYNSNYERLQSQKKSKIDILNFSFGGINFDDSLIISKVIIPALNKLLSSYRLKRLPQKA